MTPLTPQEIQQAHTTSNDAEEYLNSTKLQNWERFQRSDTCEMMSSFANEKISETIKLFSEKSSQLAEERAVAFAEWIYNNTTDAYKTGGEKTFYECKADEVVRDTSELFELFQSKRGEGK